MNIRPKLLHSTTLAVLLSLALGSCGKGEDVIDAVTTDNDLLGYVPADTPYVAGNLEPLPEAVIEANFRRAQPALEAVQQVLADSKLKLSGSAARENPEAAIMGAVLAELDGKLNREGLESLGFTMDAYQVVYGMGAFPVMRVTLGNAQALRDAIGRVETASGLDFAENQHQGQPYWNLASSLEDENDGASVGVYLAIIEQGDDAHLAFSLFPSSAEAELLASFLGQDKPAENTAALKLAEISNAYGYSEYGSGLMDFEKLFDQFVDSNSLLNRALIAQGVDPSAHLDEVCQAEIRGLIARAPRMVAGVSELSASTIGVQYRLELADDLAGELAELVSSVPAVPSRSDRLLEFAFGIRVGAARDFLIRKATALSQETYQCEALQSIPETASEALVKLNTPMPPLVNNFRGLRASLSSMPEDESDLESIRGTVAFHVEKPEMFVGMAQMMLPQLAEFELSKGAPPVRLPESLIPIPGVVAHAAMSDSAIGIAVGEGEQAGLLAYLESKSGDDGSFFSANYDMAAYLERMDQLARDLERAGMTDDTIMDGEFEGDDASRARMEEISEAMREAVQNMAGRSQFYMRFDEKGIAVDSRMEFRD